MSKKKIKKTKYHWTKNVNRNSAFDLGFHLGARKTLEFLAEEGIIAPEIIAWLLEEKYYQDIAKRK